MNTISDKESSNDTSEINSDYYVGNFHTLVSYVVDLYDDLLTSAEKRWYASICCSDLRAQQLYIRLLSRKGSFFRLSRLNYGDIDDCQQAAEQLQQQNLASCDPPDTLSGLLPAFTKPELLQILGLQTHRTLSRPELVAHIEQSNAADRSSYLSKLQEQDRWICLYGHANWMLMQLCFFGNLYQDSSEFVVSQLGNLRYADYSIEPSARAFTSRENIIAHWRYFECEAVYVSVNKRCVNELLAFVQLLPDHDGRDMNLQRRTDRLRVTVARELERVGHKDEAMALYKICRTPPARERRIRLLIQDAHWNEAHQEACSVIAKPYNEAEKLVAQRLSEKCKKALGLTFKKQAVYKPVISKLVLANEATRVEMQALKFFSVNGACFYTENTLVNSVLGLFIWDIIFYPVPGVFFNPFQIAPADYYQPEFFLRRQHLFEKRFEELERVTDFHSRVLLTYHQQKGRQNPLVRWQGLSLELLSTSLERIPATHWRAMFQRILKDTREHSKGFPDLVNFPESGGYEFIEIKGPGDALQSNQRRWMKYFDEYEIACRVVKVSYQAKATERIASRTDPLSR